MTQYPTHNVRDTGSMGIRLLRGMSSLHRTGDN